MDIPATDKILRHLMATHGMPRTKPNHQEWVATNHTEFGTTKQRTSHFTNMATILPIHNTSNIPNGIHITRRERAIHSRTLGRRWCKMEPALRIAECGLNPQQRRGSCSRGRLSAVADDGDLRGSGWIGSGWLSGRGEPTR